MQGWLPSEQLATSVESHLAARVTSYADVHLDRVRRIGCDHPAISTKDCGPAGITLHWCDRCRAAAQGGTNAQI